MEQLAKQEACQLFIEQEIEEGLKRGETPYKIAKVLTGWVEKLFHAKVSQKTIESKAFRQKQAMTSNEVTDSSRYSNSGIHENQEIKFEHGGAREGAGRPPKFAVIQDNSQFRTEGTGENEWYTPLQYIESARQVLGEIDLDPATSEFGQGRIKANGYFTTKDNGLSLPWNGKIWLNPPYSQPLIQQFIEKAVQEYKIKNMEQAIILTHNYTDTAWFHLAESVAALICFTRGRVKFEGANGEIASPTQGSAFFYLGDNRQIFMEVFSQYGFIR